MIKKFFEALGVSLAAMLIVLGFTNSSSATTFTQMDFGDTAVIGSTSEVFSNNLFGSAISSPFTEQYFFTVTTGTWVSIFYDVIDSPEPPGGVPKTKGLTDLVFDWDKATVVANVFSFSSNFFSTTMTDSAGFDATGVDIPLEFIKWFAAGDYILTVTGAQLTSISGSYSFTLQAVPLPGAALLFGSALLGGGLMRRRKMIKKFGLPA